MKHLISATLLFFLGVSLMAQHTNHLINEESPYLQQHAHNPLQWYPWGKEAFTKAKKENKLIFLSIGYSTCHWCHVMEKESFENEQIAAHINQHFISIKIDREEMPHVDKYYQDLHYLLNKRGGGWPLSIILTPDMEPFFAATYIPSRPKYGQRGIVEMFDILYDAFINRHDEVRRSVASIKQAMKSTKDGAKQNAVTLSHELITQFVEMSKQNFDTQNGGFSQAPKFPHASALETLLDVYTITHNKEALDMALFSLDKMRSGGIYDQIEGGFYRYATDEKWLIPHFEKMLYTNAELLPAYAKAYQITGDEKYQHTVEELVAYSKNRALDENMLYSASDADSDGEEGKYFVFTYDDSFKDLRDNGFSDEEAKNVLKYFDISKKGNFEHQLSNPQVIPLQIDATRMNEAKKILQKNRARKNYPFVDKKILTAWNAMFISGLYTAKENTYATSLLEALIKNLYIDATLYHQKLPHTMPTKKALFEDYSFLITALLAGFNATSDDKYLVLAQTLTHEAIKKFYIDATWYLSDDDFKTPAEIDDNSYKSHLANMIANLYTLAVLTDDQELQDLANHSLEGISFTLSRYPSAYPWALRTYMLKTYGAVVIKSQETDKAKEVFAGSYPFLNYKAWRETNHQACKIDVCFAYDKDMKTLKKKVQEGLNIAP